MELQTEIKRILWYTEWSGKIITLDNKNELAEDILAKVREVIESHNSIDYPYGADFKQAILKAMGD